MAPVIFGNEQHCRPRWPKTEQIRWSLKLTSSALQQSPYPLFISKIYSLSGAADVRHLPGRLASVSLSCTTGTAGQKTAPKNGDTAHLTLRAIVLRNNGAAIGFRRGVAPLKPPGTAWRSGEKRVKGDPHGLMLVL